jgi:hypothetical protein
LDYWIIGLLGRQFARLGIPAIHLSINPTIHGSGHSSSVIRHAICMNLDADILIVLKVLAVLALVLLNGFFVAAEFALVRIRETQLDMLVAKGWRRGTSSGI